MHLIRNLYQNTNEIHSQHQISSTSYQKSFLEPVCCKKQKKSSWTVTGLWNRRPLKDLNDSKLIVQSNLAIRNFLVALKLFLNAKCFLSLWSKLQIGRGKWFLNTNKFLIKPFLIAKFDCIWVQVIPLIILSGNIFYHSESSEVPYSTKQ
jgi:hypothetical protein